MRPLKKASDMTVAELAAYIDQSVLKPEFTQEEIRKYIREGIDFGCRTVCINPASLPIASEMVRETNTKVCVVCDFPFGLSSTASKVLQATELCKNESVAEVDVVSNYGWIRSGLWDDVCREVKAVAEVCHSHQKAVKVILETDALTKDEIRRAVEIVAEAGADFVKSSTGFFTGGKNEGAATEVIRIMLDAAKGHCKVKGSGCIRTREHFLELIDMGIDRMGIGYKSTPVVLGLTK